MANQDKVQETSGEEVKPTPSQVDLSQFVSIEEFRKMQSKKDREAAEERNLRLAAEQRAKQQQEEFLRLVESKPELRENYERVQTEIKARQYEELTQRQQRLQQYKEGMVQAYGVPVEELADAETEADAFAKARAWERKKILEDVRKELGVPASEDKEPLALTPTQGPSPDATLETEAERSKRLRDLEDKLKDPNTPKREKQTLRQQWLKGQSQGSMGRPRTRV